MIKTSLNPDDYPFLTDKAFMKEIKKHIAKLDRAIRNFEVVYIDMIQALKRKVFGMDVDTPFDESFIMQSNQAFKHK